MRLLGVDPGLSGAIACFDTDLSVLAVRDMPVAKASQNRNQLIETQLANIVRGFAPDVAIVELVHAMPKQGVTSVFTFGQTLGAIKGVLAALGVPVNFLTPHEWRRLARVPGRGGPQNKHLSRVRAAEVFPNHADLFERVRDHGRADAALLIYAFLKL